MNLDAELLPEVNWKSLQIFKHEKDVVDKADKEKGPKKLKAGDF